MIHKWSRSPNSFVIRDYLLGGRGSSTFQVVINGWESSS